MYGSEAEGEKPEAGAPEKSDFRKRGEGNTKPDKGLVERNAQPVGLEVVVAGGCRELNWPIGEGPDSEKSVMLDRENNPYGVLSHGMKENLSKDEGCSLTVVRHGVSIWRW